MNKAALVSARVPIEIKKQGNAILENIGSTPTQLVNSAYQYVINHGALPVIQQELKPARRVLSAAQANRIKARTLLMALPGSELNMDVRELKTFIAEGRRADYEALT
jgi:addiction module RelB/DinJ family antitoxin